MVVESNTPGQKEQVRNVKSFNQSHLAMVRTNSEIHFDSSASQQNDSFESNTNET